MKPQQILIGRQCGVGMAGHWVSGRGASIKAMLHISANIHDRSFAAHGVFRPMMGPGPTTVYPRS